MIKKKNGNYDCEFLKDIEKQLCNDVGECKEVVSDYMMNRFIGDLLIPELVCCLHNLTVIY